MVVSLCEVAKVIPRLRSTFACARNEVDVEVGVLDGAEGEVDRCDAVVTSSSTRVRGQTARLDANLLVGIVENLSVSYLVNSQVAV